MEGISCNTLRKAHDHYGKLRAFAIMLVTDDEQMFCECYKIATGKSKREAGHQTWNIIKYGFAYWRNKDFLRSKHEIQTGGRK